MPHFFFLIPFLRRKGERELMKNDGFSALLLLATLADSVYNARQVSTPDVLEELIDVEPMHITEVYDDENDEIEDSLLAWE